MSSRKKGGEGIQLRSGTRAVHAHARGALKITKGGAADAFPQVLPFPVALTDPRPRPSAWLGWPDMLNGPPGVGGGGVALSCRALRHQLSAA